MSHITCHVIYHMFHPDRKASPSPPTIHVWTLQCINWSGTNEDNAHMCLVIVSHLFSDDLISRFIDRVWIHFRTNSIIKLQIRNKNIHRLKLNKWSVKFYNDTIFRKCHVINLVGTPQIYLLVSSVIFISV